MKSKLLKKVLSVALSAIVITTTAFSLPIVVNSGAVSVSVAETYEDYRYEVNDDNTITITKYTGSGGDVTIPAVIEGKSVTSIGWGAFIECTGLTSVTIPDSVTSIREYAFNDCTALTSITIPDSVTIIGNCAFHETKWLDNQPDGLVYAGKVTYTYKGEMPSETKIILKKGTKGIADSAFENCKGLTGVTIPNSVTSIGWSAFLGCRGLTGVTIPDSVTNIDDRAFYSCTGLTGVTIGNGVTSIGGGAFEYCWKLTSVTIPNSVISIGYSAFSNCYNLTGVTIPDSVTSIGHDAFTDTIWLDNKHDGLVYAGKVAYTYKGKIPSGTKIVLKNGTKGIAGGAFYGCTDLTGVTIPNSVTNIGDSAFYDCTGLTSVTIPDSVTSIGEEAFYGCTGLTSVTIPDSVTNIGDYAFSDCTGLTGVTIGNGVTSIGNRAFMNCTGLNNVSIENGTSITSSTFEGCTGLTNVTIESGTIGNSAFYGFTGLTGVTFGNGVTSIGYCAFKNCTGLTSITIPNSVTSIGDHAFYGCTGLTGITIPNGVTSIGECAFFNCTGLSSVIIGNSVTSIGNNAFKYCKGLTSVTIPDSVTSIDVWAFSSCTGLTNVTIGNSVTSIGEYAFDNCANLTSVTIPDSVTSIDDSAFRNCTGLTSITIPDGVRSIGVATFENCTGLTNVLIPDSVTSVDYEAFYRCTSLKDVYYSGTKEQWDRISIGSGNDCLKNATIRYGAIVIDTGKIGNLNYELNDWGVLTISGKGDMPDYTDKTSPFYGKTDIMQIVIKDGVTSIGAYAFQDMGGLMSITIPDSVAKINAHAFDGNNSMVYIKAEGVTEIGESAFKNCKNFSFELPNGLKTIGNEAFYGCTSIGNIIIPSSVETVGQNAFAKCGMTSVAFSDGLKTIPEGTFADCQNLTSVTIPYTVTKVDKNAFSGCQSLITVFYDGFEDEWNEIVIESGNDKLKSAAVHWRIPLPTLDQELLDKTKQYTSDGGAVYRMTLERLNRKLTNDDISQEDKLEMIHNFCTAFNVTDVREGVEYCNDEINGKRAYDFLTCNDAFLAYQFKWWLHNTPGGTVARGYMISGGWLYNNELKQYLNPKTYITGETVDIKNYKAMLLSFMQYKVDNGVGDDAKTIVGNASKVRKYLSSLTKEIDEKVLEKVDRDFVAAIKSNPGMTMEQMEEELNKIYKNHNVFAYAEGNPNEGRTIVHHLEGFPELQKAFNISGNVLKIASTGLNDVFMFINLESKLETIENYRTFLELVADGKDYLPFDLCVAAQQLLDQTINPYQAELKQLILDVFDCTNGVCKITDKIKKKITSAIKEKYPTLFGKVNEFGSTFGDAIAVIEVSAVVVDALTKVGTVIKDAAYVEAYAYLGQYFTLLLRDKRDQFRANETIDNAWEFYDMYHLLFRVRTCGENAYLKMCKESAVTEILAKAGFKWFDISDREQYVKNTFDHMNKNCFFGLDNAKDIPEAHKYAQKAVVKCPVDVEILDSKGKTVYTMLDGNEQDVSNSIGRFTCRYDPKLADYIKIIYLHDDKSYTIKALGNDFGTVGIETSRITSDNKVSTAKIAGLPIEETGIITLDMKTNEYQDDISGDNKQIIEGTMEQTTDDNTVNITALALTEKSVRIQEGDKKSVGLVIAPTNATYTNVIWSSSDESIATVNAGAITAVAQGTAVITAETYDGKFKAECSVVVNPKGIAGDTNGDGIADIADALMISRYDAGLITLDSTQISVSDVNSDGSADIADALMIARYDAGLIERLGWN